MAGETAEAENQVAMDRTMTTAIRPSWARRDVGAMSPPGRRREILDGSGGSPG
jgi:hypothetical protein